MSGRFSPSKVREIIAEVAAKHDLAPKDLTGKRRFKDFNVARHEAMWRVRRELSVSYPAIGRAFGGRDHSTAMNGVRKHEARRAAL